MQGAGRGARNRLGHVFRVAPLGLLHQQPAQVLLAAPLGFLAPKEGGERRMKGGEGRAHPLKLCLIHLFSLLTESLA